MEFIQENLSIHLSRVKYCLINHEEKTCEDDSDIKALELYIGYTHLEEWGSVGDNFVNLNDVMLLKQGLTAVHERRSDRFEFSIKTIWSNENWMKFLLERIGSDYHFRFEWRELYCDELFVIDQVYSSDEWKPYFEEFLLWGEEFPVQLGDRVMGIDPDEEDFEEGMEGRIDVIYPREEHGAQVEMMVSYIRESWNGPYRAGKVMKLD